MQAVDLPATTQEKPVENHAKRFPNGNSSLFTKATARLAGLASVAARAAKKLEPEPEPEAIKLDPLPTDQDSFRPQSLLRTRNSIKSLHRQLDREVASREAKARCACGLWVVLPLPDSKRIKELADSVAKLSELERQLAGRPLPGSLKPTTAKTRASSQVEPVE